MPDDRDLRAHREWLGFLQPIGLVVSPTALADAQAFVNERIGPVHDRFLAHVEEAEVGSEGNTASVIKDFPAFACDILEWRPDDLIGGPGAEALPDALEVVLADYGETLRPTWGVRDVPAPDGSAPWLMLVVAVPSGQLFDEVPPLDSHCWQASHQVRCERLLRSLAVPIGLLTNGTHLRLVYAPAGETSGHLTFPVQAMSEVMGRPIFAALSMLLSAERLFTLPDPQRLGALLAASRKAQARVSTALSSQVLAALYELLRGFQAADDQRRGELLRAVLREDPDHVYAGLLTVLLRLIFILYAEDRGLLPPHPVYQRHYALAGLYERLRADAGRHADTMDHRYGAWAQLLAVFRLLHDGGGHGGLRLPQRQGHLLDPDRFPFLEGRPWGSCRQKGERLDPPLVSDRVVFRVLEKLLMLDGERLSYRTLGVEEIGTVYQAMMGFHLGTTSGRSIAVKPKKAHGAPSVVDLDELLRQPAGQRAKWLLGASDQKVEGAAATSLAQAATPEEAVAALERKVARDATPGLVPPGAMVLEPSDERRRSGSHYTPASLTGPIVKTTLDPVVERLGPRPTPEQILELKVCDLAVGSGAFLVAACRYLGDRLVTAWHDHGTKPLIPPDEDELIHARRLVAQRCLYGVDKNPLAADLAKLSLWLETLARDHAFTFLDHAIRHGDSLVGLTKAQIASFHWVEQPQRRLWPGLEQRLKEAAEWRAAIRLADEEVHDHDLRDLMRAADEALADVRLIGDLAVSAFFRGGTDRERERIRRELLGKVEAWLQSGAGRDELRRLAEELREGQHPVEPFHWEVEFPEVFGRENPGFDAVVGNPPFLGGNKVWAALGGSIRDWIGTTLEGSGGRAVDLVAHFFRRAFLLLADRGAFGLVATNTIAQGDTRASGLGFIVSHGGQCYEAVRRLPWPGDAAVTVSVVHVLRGPRPTRAVLDGRTTPGINSHLLPLPFEIAPNRLAVNQRVAFVGCHLYGSGFLFDDSDPDATSTGAMKQILESDPRGREIVAKFIGGEDINTHPLQESSRWVINFRNMPLEAARGWPSLISIVEEKVRPLRAKLGGYSVARSRAERWWQFGTYAASLFERLQGVDRCLVLSQVSSHFSLVFSKTDCVYSHGVCAFVLDQWAAFSILQSRTHELWARFFSSTLEDRLRYNSADCFETFPLPEDWRAARALELPGDTYHSFRASLMIANDEGLTKTYNRFHDPEHDGSGVEGRAPADVVRDVERLRELHDAMDRAVLEAYGWTDLRPRCEFLLDYEEDDDEEGGGRRRKKPWRYRWPDDVRDEVLARLLELNRQRAEEERLSGAAEAKSAKVKKPKRSRKADDDTPVMRGFDFDEPRKV